MRRSVPPLIAAMLIFSACAQEVSVISNTTLPPLTSTEALTGIAPTTSTAAATGGSVGQTAEWFAQIAASQDPFFHGFAFGGPDSYWAEDAEWGCIALSVVQALDTPATHEEYSQLNEMALSSPDSPSSLKLEAVEVLAGLPMEERLRIAGVVVSAAQSCGDLRVNLYGGGGAASVCVYDRSSDEVRERIVAYSMLGRGGDVEEEFVPEAQEIVLGCWSLLQEAEESKEELLWVADLKQRFNQEWDERSEASNG